MISKEQLIIGLMLAIGHTLVIYFLFMRPMVKDIIEFFSQKDK